MTKLDVFNHALAHMEVSQMLVSTESTGTAARVLNAMWENANRAVLVSHPWRGAAKRNVLSSALPTPDFEFSYSFPIPEELLRIISIGSNWRTDGLDYVLEGKRLLTNASAVYLRYVFAPSSPVEIQDYINIVIGHYLAMIAAPAITSARVTRRDLQIGYNQALAIAKAADAGNRQRSRKLTNRVLDAQYGYSTSFPNVSPDEVEFS